VLLVDDDDDDVESLRSLRCSKSETLHSRVRCCVSSFDFSLASFTGNVGRASKADSYVSCVIVNELGGHRKGVFRPLGQTSNAHHR
jgi:hypothetical protein